MADKKKICKLLSSVEIPGPTAWMLSCHNAKSKAKNTPANAAKRNARRLCGSFCPKRRISSQNTAAATASRQNATAYGPTCTNFTIRLPSPNTTQPKTSSGAA